MCFDAFLVPGDQELPRPPGDGGDRRLDKPMPNAAITTDPPLHATQRKLISRAFTPKALRGYTPMIQGIVDGLIDDFIDDGRVEFVSSFASQLPLRVTCDIMGVSGADSQWLMDWGQLEGPGAVFQPPEKQRLEAERGKAMGAFLARTIQDKIADPQDDALSDLVRDQTARDGEPELPYLVAEAALLLFGGLVTTAHHLASTMLLLLDNPEVLDRVQREPEHVHVVTHVSQPSFASR